MALVIEREETRGGRVGGRLVQGTGWMAEEESWEPVPERPGRPERVRLCGRDR